MLSGPASAGPEFFGPNCDACRSAWRGDSSLVTQWALGFRAPPIGRGGKAAPSVNPSPANRKYTTAPSPGAVGAVIVHFARQAAIRTSGPARRWFAWIDWLPLRLIGLVFALVCKFEETIDALRGVSPIAARADHSVDPYAHQRLLLLGREVAEDL